MLLPSIVLQPSLTPPSPPALPHLLTPSSPLGMRMLMVHSIAAAAVGEAAGSWWCDPGSSPGRAHSPPGATTSSRSSSTPSTGVRTPAPPPPSPLPVPSSRACPAARIAYARCGYAVALTSTPIADVCARLFLALPLNCRSRRGGSKGQKSEVALKRSFRNPVIKRACAILSDAACRRAGPVRRFFQENRPQSVSVAVGCRQRKPRCAR